MIGRVKLKEFVGRMRFDKRASRVLHPLDSDSFRFTLGKKWEWNLALIEPKKDMVFLFAFGHVYGQRTIFDRFE